MNLLVIPALVATMTTQVPFERPEASPIWDMTEQQMPQDAGLSCGEASLFVLCRVSGEPKPLSDIRRRLFKQNEAIHSLRELRDAGRALGFRLQGITIRGFDPPLRQPALVHLDRHPLGHFVVVRPVGHTGRLVQILDGDEPPRVVEFDRLVDSPEWTGLALIHSTHPSSSVMFFRFICGLICVLGVSLAVSRISRWVGLLHLPSKSSANSS